MGEELGLEDAAIPAERAVDPGGRDGCRAPIPWSAAPPHGWSAEPWLPFPPDAAARSLERQRADAGSVLQLYRRLLAARRASPALREGSLELLASPDDVLLYRRRCGDDARLVAIHFGEGEARLEPGEAWRVELASDGAGEGDRFDGRIAGDRALVLTRG
jgi:alpha-glucosidase